MKHYTQHNTCRHTVFYFAKNICLVILHQCKEQFGLFLPYQERGSRNGKGLLVKISTTEEQQHISSVLCLVKLQERSQFPQLLQV